MIGGKLGAGERLVSTEELAGWALDVWATWTVTIRPREFDENVTPIDFPVGRYTAHDHYYFLHKRLLFVVVVAEVYDERGSLIGYEEISGVEWRPRRVLPGRTAVIGDADVAELVSAGERKTLVTNAVLHAVQAGGRP